MKELKSKYLILAIHLIASLFIVFKMSNTDSDKAIIIPFLVFPTLSLINLIAGLVIKKFKSIIFKGFYILLTGFTVSLYFGLF